MARPSGIYWGVGFLMTLLLVHECSVVIFAANRMPWFEPVGGGLALAFALLLVGTFHWVVRGGGSPAVVGAVMIRLYRIAFALPVLVHRGICWLRAAIGPGHDLFRGITHLRQGRLEQAVEALEKHLQRSPTEMAGLVYATLAFVKLGRYRDALRHLDAAIARRPLPDALALRSQVFGTVGATQEALQDAEAALLQRSKNPRFHFYRALALVQAGRADEALEVLKGPGRPEKFHLNWWPLSVALSRRGNGAAAADACSRVVPLVATYRFLSPMPWDQADEAWALVRIGKLDQAEKATLRTLAKNQGDHEALAVQALVHTRRSDTDRALQVLEEAGRRNPFVVVDAARDPFFAPLVATPRFSTLLEQATRDWQARLASIRSRPGIAAGGA